jgi:hypothetical protein
MRSEQEIRELLERTRRDYHLLGQNKRDKEAINALLWALGDTDLPPLGDGFIRFIKYKGVQVWPSPTEQREKQEGPKS